MVSGWSMLRALRRSSECLPGTKDSMEGSLTWPLAGSSCSCPHYRVSKSVLALWQPTVPTEHPDRVRRQPQCRGCQPGVVFGVCYYVPLYPKGETQSLPEKGMSKKIHHEMLRSSASFLMGQPGGFPSKCPWGDCRHVPALRHQSQSILGTMRISSAEQWHLEGLTECQYMWSPMMGWEESARSRKDVAKVSVGTCVWGRTI